MGSNEWERVGGRTGEDGQTIASEDSLKETKKKKELCSGHLPWRCALVQSFLLQHFQSASYCSTGSHKKAAVTDVCSITMRGRRRTRTHSHDALDAIKTTRRNVDDN